ncbi:inorganic diphosphatase [Buchnera aphidicola]|uniref:Inorganic pyrophosphatase n=1 Tax=Buchnera aphidicola (Sarucallis kahawaluokalani) TaxID=1241878 RepID=A0A4D6Y7I4_9GAMM|nr:inorganic diphosphatase [Buchnera aphidicola]QCI25866.1 inorganic diphosphatase [Buchnera aphidicola (Sarucallis kahawaluokalani)]
MNLKNVPAGKNIPHDIYVIIEIPYQSYPIKYEIDKKTNNLFVDRFIPTAMFYPCNYGYINQTLSDDGDPLDVLIPVPYKLQFSCVIRCRPIGMLSMVDESGTDNKIIAVPHKKICSDYKNIQDIDDLSIDYKTQITHFFQHYKDLEKKKWVKIIGFENTKSAKSQITQSIEKYLTYHKK